MLFEDLLQLNEWILFPPHLVILHRYNHLEIIYSICYWQLQRNIDYDTLAPFFPLLRGLEIRRHNRFQIRFQETNLDLYSYNIGNDEYIVTDTQIGYPKPKTRVLDFGCSMKWRNGFKASQTRLFLIFCQIFGIFDDFSKWRSVNHQICQNKLAKNEEKPWLNLSLKPIFQLIPGTRKSDFRYPIRH